MSTCNWPSTTSSARCLHHPIRGRSHAGSDKLFARICGVIRDGFSDPDFGPAEVARETGVSLRYVQRLLHGARHDLQRIRRIRIAWIVPHILCIAGRCWERASQSARSPSLAAFAIMCISRERFRRRFGHPPGAHAGHSHVNDDRTARAGTETRKKSARDIQFRTS